MTITTLVLLAFAVLAAAGLAWNSWRARKRQRAFQRYLDKHHDDYHYRIIAVGKKIDAPINVVVGDRHTIAKFPSVSGAPGHYAIYRGGRVTR
jgi:hypothetical protein